MYMDYSKLWKLLIDKDMTKTELMSLTGISSRVLAKLSKNETVTTETLVRICTVLGCDVGDIMECREEKKLSLYNYYRKFGTVAEETEGYKTVRFEFDGKRYVIYAVKKAPPKASVVHCKENGTVYLERFYPFGGTASPSRVESVLVKPTRARGEITIVLFKGKPGFTGLDDGLFVSSRCKLKNDSQIYVMSEAAFKLFEIQD